MHMDIGQLTAEAKPVAYKRRKALLELHDALIPKDEDDQ